MKGDFSRLTGLKAIRKHYNGVLKQQGRVQLDSDWNEHMSIVGHQRKVRTIDTIGKCGAPKHNSGFEILHPGNGLVDLLIATGRFYAGGLLCETTPGSKLALTGFSGNDTVLADDTNIDGVELKNDQWVQIATEENPDGVIAQITNVADGEVTVDQDLSALQSDHHPTLRRLLLFSGQPDLPNGPAYTPVGGQTDLLYLDVWERHITVIEDPKIREVALGGPDTDTRSRIVGQVKILPDVGDADCSDDLDQWNELVTPPNGRLTTRLVEPPEPDNPCELGESGGYLGLENHLYRVEIHAVGAGGATFKWSRDNASTAYAVKEFIEEPGGQVFKIDLKQQGKDEILKIKQQDWVEVSGEYTDLDTENPGTLAKVTKVEGTVLTLDQDVSAHKDEPLPKVRRWDTNVQTPDEVTKTIVAGTGFLLEDGIEIEFSGTEFKSGDYWVFSARVLTGEIEVLDKEAPMGIRHHYCKLAMVTGLADGNVTIEDCRPEFPPLTEIEQGSGCCTAVVGEGEEEFRNIQAAVNSLNGGPGVVCIKPGMYLIDEPIQVSGRDITIKGCEGSPIIVNTGSEQGNDAVFQVAGSLDIHMHDLWCISYSGARVVEVSNTSLFSLHDCMLIAGGTSDLAGVITFIGLGLNTRVEDNLVLGMTGVRYEPISDQSLNLQLNTRIERNSMFVLENGVLQASDVLFMGFDLIDNLMLGFSFDMLANVFFPDDLFKEVEKQKVHKASVINKAKKVKGKSEYKTIKAGNQDGLNQMNKALKTEENLVNAQAGSLAAANFPTSQPLVYLDGGMIDGSLYDNQLLGSMGIYSRVSLESLISSNLLWVQQEGIILGMFEGMMISDNMVISGQTALKCNGTVALNLSVENNRLTSQTNGVSFMEKGEEKIQLAWNIHFHNNWIDAKETGISLEESGIVLADFTVVDNTIRSCERTGIHIYVFDENQYQETDVISLQRVIQRNSISVKGAGIVLNVSDCKILDNDINIDHDAVSNASNTSRGISLLANNGIIANNTVQAIVNDEAGKDSLGGIFLRRSTTFTSTRQQQIEVRNNQIFGGVQNGIEIGSDFEGLRIIENQISGMGLNGIAVPEFVISIDDLQIQNNHIQHCLNRAGMGSSWWKYAGIVLTASQKTHITGNVVCENAQQLPENIYTGALFAERLQQAVIAENIFRNNEAPNLDNPNEQAAVHIPANGGLLNTSVDIQMTNNQIYSVRALCLDIGDLIYFGDLSIPTTYKTVFTGNLFESERDGPIVRIESINIQFSSNQVLAGEANAAVFLGHGWNLVATGNVLSDSISWLGTNQIIDNNMIW